MKRPVLLLGNGLNNLSPGYSWKDLTRDLSEMAGYGELSLDGKPFPLVYEQLIVRALRSGRCSERDLKERIADRVRRLEVNDLHRDFVAMAGDEIITTNYDTVLERALGWTGGRIVNEGVVPEIAYSLFRFNTVDDVRLWHIHGLATSPSSIMLGYEHYSGYLQMMRSYLATGTGRAYRNRSFEPFPRRLRRGSLDINSWLDLFLTRDIAIVGLAMDFVEIHLWWLITWRARLIHEHGLPVDNSILYFHPTSERDRLRHRAALLGDAGVDVREVPDRGGWRRYYERVRDTLAAG